MGAGIGALTGDGEGSVTDAERDADTGNQHQHRHQHQHQHQHQQPQPQPQRQPAHMAAGTGFDEPAQLRAFEASVALQFGAEQGAFFPTAELATLSAINASSFLRARELAQAEAARSSPCQQPAPALPAVGIVHSSSEPPTRF